MRVRSLSDVILSLGADSRMLGAEERPGPEGTVLSFLRFKMGRKETEKFPLLL